LRRARGRRLSRRVARPGRGSVNSPPVEDGLLVIAYWYPPPPFILQNLEKTRFILRLPARSLSLKELHVKSREHWSYGGARRPILESRDAFAGSRSRASIWVRLSKINDYLVDNVRCSRLSDFAACGQ